MYRGGESHCTIRLGSLSKIGKNTKIKAKLDVDVDHTPALSNPPFPGQDFPMILFKQFAERDHGGPHYGFLGNFRSDSEI